MEGAAMEVSVKELPVQPGRIISVTQTENDESANDEAFAFGMWKDREDMKDPSDYVAKVRSGRIIS
jgi:hypothetical protein